MSKDYVNTRSEALSLVKRRLKQFEVEPIAILHHGSRVSKNSYPASDWDFYIVAKFNDKPVRPEFIFKKSFIDVGFLKYEDVVKTGDFIKTSNLLPSQKFEVLWTKDEKSSKFVNKVIDSLEREYNESKRETWTDIRTHRLETYFYRNIYRISECNDKLRRNIYIALYLDKVARNQYFHFTNQFNHSISEGYKIIKKQDPKLYDLLVKLPKLRSKRAIKSNLTKIYQYFIMLDKKHPSTMGVSQYGDQGSRLA